MDRRTFIASSAALSTGFGGCVGDSGNSSDVTDETDGYPDESLVESPPEELDVDTDSFERLSVEGTEVPLVPVDVAHYWYQRRDARFADARGEGQYDGSHVVGAVFSPAAGRDDDPAVAWPTDSRIVTYCGCPHHLSSLRAARFIENGYDQVYAIDEGYFEWRDRGYPVTGDDANQASFVIDGRADGSAAGGYAWATHEPSDQHEAAPIGDDGSYRLELHFANVDAATPIAIQTPSYELTAPLSDLTDDVVTGGI